MCITCGCGPNDLSGHHHDHGHDHHKSKHHTHGHDNHHGKGTRTIIAIEEDILAKNNRLASFNRALFKEKGIFVLNLVSSPGSGKTTLLERTLRDLNGKFRFAVIEGDQQTDNDAQRIAATGVPVRQINTGSGCHLDFNVKKCKEFAQRVSPGITIFDVSAKTGEGMNVWYQWLAAGAENG